MKASLKGIRVFGHKYLFMGEFCHGGNGGYLPPPPLKENHSTKKALAELVGTAPPPLSEKNRLVVSCGFSILVSKKCSVPQSLLSFGTTLNFVDTYIEEWPRFKQRTRLTWWSATNTANSIFTLITVNRAKKKEKNSKKDEHGWIHRGKCVHRICACKERGKAV